MKMSDLFTLFLMLAPISCKSYQTITLKSEGGRLPASQIETSTEGALVSTLDDLSIRLSTPSERVKVFLAATPKELVESENLDNLIRDRANLICKKLAAENGKSYSKCDGQQLADFEGPSYDIFSERTVPSAPPRQVSGDQKKQYCQGEFASTQDGGFCEEPTTKLMGKRFSQVTCLLSDKPFPAKKPKQRSSTKNSERRAQNDLGQK